MNRQNFTAVVKSDEFAQLERPLLEAVVERDTGVNIAEVELFKGVVEWATKVSGKARLSIRWARKKKNSRRTDCKSNPLPCDEAEGIYHGGP